MIKDMININGIQVEVIIYNTDSIIEDGKVGIRPLIYELFSRGIIDGMTIKWINNVNGSCDNLKHVLNSLVDNFADTDIIMTSPGTLTGLNTKKILSIKTHQEDESDILKECNFFDIYFTSLISSYMKPTCVYNNKGAMTLVDRLNDAGLIDTRMM